MIAGHIRSLAAVLLAACLTGNAQPPPQFTIAGAIVDPSGAVVVGASISLKGGHGQERSAVTDATGHFAFTGVSSANYEIRAQYAGFKSSKTRVKVRERNPAPLRIALEIADLRDEITVNAGETNANTDTTSNLNAIKLTPEMLEKLPIMGQDVVAALSLALDPASVGSHGPTVVVDGLPSSEIGVPASAIEDVRINQNPYSAEFARPGRGRIEVTTKSGSSKYNGSFYFGLRDYRLDARNTFAVDRPQEQRRQFEGYLSGPFLKSKKTTFLFSASRSEDDLQSVVYAQGLQGAICENTPKRQRSTYLIGQLTRREGKNTLSARYFFFDWSDRGSGVGGVNLPEIAVDSVARVHQIQTNYKAVITPKLLNEFLVRIRNEGTTTESVHPGVPKIVVLDAFSGGGAQIAQHNNDNLIELTDMLSLSHGRHLIKTGINVPALSRQAINDRVNFNGTFYFSSLYDYARGRPFSFERQQGESRLVYWQKELGLFIQDDVQILPNLSMAYGLRYDWQNYLSEHKNFAPRLSFAFAPWKGRRTVLRGGAGLFYDTTGPAAIADTLRYDGIKLQQVLLSNPGYPDPLSLGGSFSSLPGNVTRFAHNLRSPYLLQFSFGMERQLQKSLTWTASYIGTRGIGLFRSRDVNAPRPPVYAARPDPSIGVFRQIESSGHLESHSVESMLRGNLTRFFNGMVLYTFNRAYNDTNGIGSYPANNYDLSGEWSRALFDARHVFYAYGTVDVGKYFSLGLVFSSRSGRPYGITTGRDDNKDGFANDRPPGTRRNSVQGPAWATLDLRWSRKLFGREHKKKERGASASVGLDAFNVLNRVNYSNPVGNLSSPFFGRPVAAGPARRVQASLSFKF